MADAKKTPGEPVWIRKVVGRTQDLDLQKNKGAFTEVRDILRESASDSTRIPLHSEAPWIEDMPLAYDQMCTALDTGTSVVQILWSCMKLLKSADALVEFEKLLDQYEP